MTRYLLAAISVLLLQPFVADARKMTQEESSNSWLRVPLVQVIANPKNFDQRTIGVAGYLSTDFEDARIYLTKDFGDMKLHENGLGVEYAKSTLLMRVPEKDRKIETFHHKYVVLCGKFRAKDRKLVDVSVITPLWISPTDKP